MERSLATEGPRSGRGVGTIMARLDRPYPGKALHAAAATLLLMAAMLVMGFFVLEHRAADLRFREYTAQASFVDIRSLAQDPRSVGTGPVHTRGYAGDAVLTDAGQQVMVWATAASRRSGGPGDQILVLSNGNVPANSLVDVWGTSAGTIRLDAGGGTSITVLRAEYIEPVR